MTNHTIIRSAVIQNRRGLHARAAAKFVEILSNFDVTIEVSRNGQTVSGLSIMGLMMLCASQGSKIELKASGYDAHVALNALCNLIEMEFYEK